MDSQFPLIQFLKKFQDNDSCLEEIKKQRFPSGIYCFVCNTITKHYKLRGRVAYSCMSCRNQVYPLAGTIFEKSSTPLRTWFFALFLMTQSRDELSTKQLQRELSVTYKTAWRIHKSVRTLMEQNDGDLLKEQAYKERKWIFFNKFELKVVHKQEPVEDDEEQ
jgi:transposase